jgi:hypothetical protein
MRTALSQKLLERGALPGNEIDAILDEAEDPSLGKASVARCVRLNVWVGVLSAQGSPTPGSLQMRRYRPGVWATFGRCCSRNRVR